MNLPTPPVSLPSLPLFFVCISTFIFFLSRLVSRPVVSRLWLLTRAHLTWEPASPLEQSHSEHLDRFMMTIVEELHVRRYRCITGPAEPVKCVVCLCKIEEGEEVREIRCDHLFHRACLDTWLGYRNPTCPLCRRSLIPLRSAAKLGEMEPDERMVLPFSFLTSTRSTWWLW